MNKIVKSSLVAAAALSLGVMTTSAKQMTAAQIEELASFVAGGVESSKTVYIHGNYVYFDMVTMADLIASGATTDEAKLYYKDGKDDWQIHDGQKWKDVSNTSNLSFEMTKLIGAKNGDHVSKDDVYDNDYLGADSHLDGRIAENFVDESAELSIVSVTPVADNVDLNSVVGNDTNKYNTNAVSVVLKDNSTSTTKKGTLTITENSPLLEYYNARANSTSTVRKKWIGLVIRTNRALTNDDTIHIVPTGTTATSSANAAKYDTVTAFGGDSRDYLVWVNEADIVDKDIIVKSKDDENNPVTLQTIKVTYENIKYYFEENVSVPTDGSTVKVTDLTDGFDYVIAKIDNTYKVIVYTNSNTLLKAEFAINGDKKVASRTSGTINVWTPTDLPQLRSTRIANATNPLATSSNVWNQTNTTVSFTENTNTNIDYDYLVEVVYSKVLKDKLTVGVDVILDLSVKYSNTSLDTIKPAEKVTIVSGSRSAYGVLSDDEIVVKLIGDEATATFSNEKGDELVIKFVLVDGSAKLEPTINKGLPVGLYDPYNSGAEYDANIAYNANIENSKLDINHSENSNLYVVNIIQTGEAFKPVSYNNAYKTWFGIVIDFGVDPSLLTYKVGSGSSLTIKNADITAASRHYPGSSKNAFVYWVGEDQTVTFTNKDTNVTVTIEFDIQNLSAGYLVDTDDNTSIGTIQTVIIDDKYANEVSWDNGKFTVTDKYAVKGKTFTATVGAVKNNVYTSTSYTYVVTAPSTTTTGNVVTNGSVTKIQNVTIKDVVEEYYTKFNQLCQETYDKSEKTSDDLEELENCQVGPVQRYNQDAIEVTFDKNTQTVTVIVNKDLGPVDDHGKLYGLVLELDVNSINIVTDKDDPEGLYPVFETEDLEQAYRHVKDVNSDESNYALLWVGYSEKDIVLEIMNTKTITGVNNGKATKSEPYKLTIKTVYNVDSSKQLSLVDTGKIELDSNNFKVSDFTDADYTGETKKFDDFNDAIENLVDKFEGTNKAINPTIENGKVVISYDKAFDKIGETKFGIILDLGINPDWISLTGANASKATIEHRFNEQYGATGTEFVLWLDANTTELKTVDGILSLEFTQEHPDNTGDRYGKNLTVKFVLHNVIDEISISKNNIIERAANANANSWTYDKELYAVNQERFNFAFTSAADGNTITISPVSDDNKTGATYVISGATDAKEKEWYAIVINVGRKIDNVSDGGNFRIEPINYDNGEFILWVNHGNNLSDKNPGTLTIMDAYNKTSVNIKVKNVFEAPKN